MPEPEFSEMGGGFKVTFKKGPVGEKGSETSIKTMEKTRVKTRDKILAIIKESPSASMNELAEQVGISQKGINGKIQIPNDC